MQKMERIEALNHKIDGSCLYDIRYEYLRHSPRLAVWAQRQEYLSFRVRGYAKILPGALD